MDDFANIAGKVPPSGGKSLLMKALYKATIAYGVQLITNPPKKYEI